MTPAFSPGPCSTYGAAVGKVLRTCRECLYEQCSLHNALTIPSSVKVGARPSMPTNRSYSSFVKPCSATSAGVIVGSPGRGGTSDMSGGHSAQDRFEQAHPVTRAEQRTAGSLGMRHQA